MSSAASIAPVAAGTATEAIKNIPEIKVDLPASLKLKLKNQAPRRAVYDVTDLTNFAAFPGVKSPAWKRIVDSTKGNSTTVGVMNGLKYLGDSTNIVLNQVMFLGNIPNFMDQMTLSNNVIYTESPASNIYKIWWKANSMANFGSSGWVPFTCLCYVEIDANDTNKMIANVYVTLMVNGAVFGQARGFYDGNTKTIYDIQKGFGGADSFDFKQNYTSNGNTYLLENSIYWDSSKNRYGTNYSIAYGNDQMGGIVDLGVQLRGHLSLCEGVSQRGVESLAPGKENQRRRQRPENHEDEANQQPVFGSTL